MTIGRNVVVDDRDLVALDRGAHRVSPYPLSYTLVWPYYFRFPSMRNHTGLQRPALHFRTPAPPQPTVRVCALGDIMVMHGDRVPNLSPELVALLSSAEVVLGCCEAPLGRRYRDPAAKYSFMFNMPVEYLEGIIDQSGVPPDRWALNIANNHAGDVGAEGPAVTQHRLRELGVTPLGGRNRNDEHPIKVFECGGLRLGLAGWTRWLNVDVFRAGEGVWRSEDISRLPLRKLRRDQALDALLGIAHWEFEWSHFPRAETRTAAAELHKAGFDLIVGSHPHVLQPLEWFGTGLSLYSLGNFCSGLGRAWPARMTSVAEIEFGTVGIHRGRVVSYRLHFFAQVNGASRIELLPLERVPTLLRNRIIRRVLRLFAAHPQVFEQSILTS